MRTAQQKTQDVSTAIMKINQEFEPLDKELKILRHKRNSLKTAHVESISEVVKLDTKNITQKKRIIKAIAREYSLKPDHLIKAGEWSLILTRRNAR